MLSDVRFTKNATWGCLQLTPDNILHAVKTAGFTLGLLTKVAESRKAAGLLTDVEAETLRELSSAITTAKGTVDNLLRGDKVASDYEFDQAALILSVADSLSMSKLAERPLPSATSALDGPVDHDVLEMLKNMQQQGGGGGGGGFGNAMQDVVNKALGGAGGAADMTADIGNASAGGGASGDLAAALTGGLGGSAQNLPAGAQNAADALTGAAGGEAGDNLEQLQQHLMSLLGQAGSGTHAGLGAALDATNLSGNEHVDSLMQMLGENPEALGGGAIGAGALGLGALAKKLLGGSRRGAKKKASADNNEVAFNEAESGLYSRALDTLGVPEANAAYIMGGRKSGLNLGTLALLGAL